MKEFMLLYRGGDPHWRTKASPKEVGVIMEKWGSWMATLQKTDQLVSGGSPLESTGKRLAKSGDVVTDIASSELKELVTGYSIVRARNLEDAVVLAKACPIHHFHDAVVEVREVMKMS